MSEIQYKYADNQLGLTIHINEASKNEKYFCPDCHGVFVFRAGTIRQKYFAHNNLTEHNCSLESYLHSTAKKLLYQKLLDKKEAKLAWPVKIFDIQIKIDKNENKIVEKKYLETYFTLDILQNAESINLEKKHGEFIPDILVSGTNEIIFIEICVTHPSTESKKNSNKVIELVIKNVEDIEKISRPNWIESPNFRLYNCDQYRKIMRNYTEKPKFEDPKEVDDCFKQTNKFFNRINETKILYYEIEEITNPIFYKDTKFPAAIKSLCIVNLFQKFSDLKIRTVNTSYYLEFISEKSNLIILDKSFEEHLSKNSETPVIRIDMLRASQTKIDDNLVLNKFQVSIKKNQRTKSKNLTNVPSTIIKSKVFAPANHWSSSIIETSIEELYHLINTNQVKLVLITEIKPSSNSV